MQCVCVMMYRAMRSDSQFHGQHLAELVLAPEPALLPVSHHSDDHPYPSSPQVPHLCTHIHRAGVLKGFLVVLYCLSMVDWEGGMKERRKKAERELER